MAYLDLNLKSENNILTLDEVEHHIWDYTYMYLHKARYFDQFCLTIFNGKRECDKRDRVWIYKEGEAE